MYVCKKCGTDVDLDPKPRYEVCATCAKQLFEAMKGQYGALASKVVALVKKAEGNHGVALFYTDEAIANPKVMETVGKQNAVKGRCPGFDATFKIFTVDPNYKPSQALATFIGGTETVVAECEGFVHAVIFNALCEIMSAPLFDAAFHDLRLGDMTYVEPLMTVKKDPLEDQLLLGDWTYIARKDMESFRLNALSGGTGGAASGWNLICTSVDAPKKFIGFGLTDKPGEVHELSLKEIEDILLHATEKKEEKPKDEKPKTATLDDFPSKPKKTMTLDFEFSTSKKAPKADFYLFKRWRIVTGKIEERVKSALPAFT